MIMVKNPFTDLQKPSAAFFIGGAGAGKTELALNLSVYGARKYGRASLIDLDIVNPFFRVRKLADEVAKENVNVICPPKGIRELDIPALPAAAWGAIENESEPAICDIGGGEPGLRPLGRLRELAEKRGAYVLFVINPFRPYFTNEQDISKSFAQLSSLSAMKPTHIIANPNLGNETTTDDFKRGLDKVQGFSDKIKLPIAFSVISSALADKLPIKLEGTNKPSFAEYEGMSLFLLERYWSVPWQFGIV